MRQIDIIRTSPTNVTFICGNTVIDGSAELKTSGNGTDTFALRAASLSFRSGEKLTNEERLGLKDLYQKYILTHEDIIEWDI